MLDVSFKCNNTNNVNNSNSKVNISSTINSDTFNETNIEILFSLFFDFLYKNGISYELMREFLKALAVELKKEDEELEDNDEDITDTYNCVLSDCDDCEHIIDCEKHDELMAEAILPKSEEKKIAISVKHITELLNSEDYLNKFRELMQTNDDLLKMVLKNWLHVVHNNNIIK